MMRVNWWSVHQVRPSLATNVGVRSGNVAHIVPTSVIPNPSLTFVVFESYLHLFLATLELEQAQEQVRELELVLRLVYLVKAPTTVADTLTFK